MTQWQQRVFALAGLCQAAACVQQLAHRGQVTPAEAINPLVSSVLAINAASIENIYATDTNYSIAANHNADHNTDQHSTNPGHNPLHIGLQIFINQFAGKGAKDQQQVELVINMLRLERILNGNSKALNELAAGLTQVARQKNDFNVANYRIMENLAGLYSGIIGPLARPILVKGKPDMLKQQAIQNQIRTLLLAGIRSAVLWRQVGGKKRHILFHRSAMVQAAKSLLLTS